MSTKQDLLDNILVAFDFSKMKFILFIESMIFAIFVLSSLQPWAKPKKDKILWTKTFRSDMAD